MQMTLDIPEPLLDQARRLLGAESEREAVILSLQDLIRRKRIEELKSLFGSIQLDVDLAESRRR
jgi:hypothetical protein